jgi:hypothetical protein
MKIRVGLPIPGGGLLRAARDLGAPLLISASAFMRPWPRADRAVTYFPGFKKPSEAFAGLDVALDSAGFVAMVLMRGFPWTVDDYVDLAAGAPWAWWAQMDLCCEPEIAGDRDTVALRQAETTRLYGECARAALRRGIALPMPVLQGWSPDDYARACDQQPVERDLLGVGSVCRRNLSGPDGIEAVVSRLDRILPPATRLHLFGVKSEAVSVLAQHPRIASVDSMAWDARSRYRNYGRNTVERRGVEMADWYRKQLQSVSHHFIQAWLYDD